MKKLFIVFFLTLIIKSNAIVIYGSEWIIPQSFGCDNGSTYVQAGFSTLNEINNDEFQIMRSTDPGFSGSVYVGASINGCGTCGERFYNTFDYGPFLPGVTYYYRVKATSNSLAFTYHTLGTFVSNIPSIVNWVSQVTTTVQTGSTPNTENSYSWETESRSMQGVTIDLLHTEISKIFVEQNNHKINFSINPSLPFININVNIDNAGYFNIYNGVPVTSFLWNNSSINITGIGLHHLYVNYTASSGTIYHREYLVYVVPGSDFLYKDNYCNTMRVWKNTTGSQGIPLLLSEGFDAYNTKPEQYYREAGKELINCLLTKGFDIYIINYKYNSQDIRNNAAIFSSGIRYVSGINNNQPIIAAGMSMGGVINRYACAKAENDGVPLPISKFLTLDAPHQGAIISSLLQNWRKTKTVGDIYAEHASNNDAAKQLLIYNAFELSGTIHPSFYNELNNLNGDGYPHLVPKIGVSFSTTAPNPDSGEWLYVNINGVPGNYDQHINLTLEEQVAGSFLPSVNIDPMPVSDSRYWSSALLSFLRPFSDPTVSITQYKNPTFISHNSSLDIVSGISKFDITIQPTVSGFHDIIPFDIIEPIVNSLLNNDLFLQDKTITDAQNYIAQNNIEAGESVTLSLPNGNFVVTGSSSTSMTAGNQIILAPGFIAANGCSFHAKIDQVHCDGVSSTQFRSQEELSEDQISNNKEEIKTAVERFNMNKVNKSDNVIIYPNPTNTYCIIETQLISKELSLYNSFGVKLFTVNSTESLTNKIDLSSQPMGIYFIKVVDINGYIHTKKIIKQ